jgi:regulator of replication initiation timing
MSDDKIAEIRARHEQVPSGNLSIVAISLAHDDRATLLVEVDRLRAENERLRADLATQQGCCDGAAAQDAHVRQEREEHRAEVEKLRADNERLFNEDTKTRHALKGWALVCPDGGDEPTHERVAAVVAEVERLRAEIERLKQEPELLRAELISLANAARNALADAYDRARDARWKASHERARNALEAKP